MGTANKNGNIIYLTSPITRTSDLPARIDTSNTTNWKHSIRNIISRADNILIRTNNVLKSSLTTGSDIIKIIRPFK